MTNALRISMLTLTLVLVPLGVPTSLADPFLDAAIGVAAEPLTTEEEELVQSAYAQFALAGIDLPALQIEFPADDSHCYGYGGVYLPSQSAIRICRPSERTMIHELAHAWLETTLTAADREAFMEVRGLDTWVGGTQWDRRGAEQAAEIITWGLAKENMLIRWLDTNPDDTVSETWRLFKIPDSHPDQLISAYQQLTGEAPQLRILDDPRSEESVSETTLSPEALRAG